MNISVKFETDYQNRKAANVLAIVTGTVRNKNLFGWRYFMEDVESHLLLYMYQTDFELPEGIYVNCGMQIAIDRARYCSALKRRCNYETISLEECYDVADSYTDSEKAKEDLYEAIVSQFGAKVADKLKPVIFGERRALDKATVRKMKTEEFRQFLYDQMMY